MSIEPKRSTSKSKVDVNVDDINEKDVLISKRTEAQELNTCKVPLITDSLGMFEGVTIVRLYMLGGAVGFCCLPLGGLCRGC